MVLVSIVLRNEALTEVRLGSLTGFLEVLPFTVNRFLGCQRLIWKEASHVLMWQAT